MLRLATPRLPRRSRLAVRTQARRLPRAGDQIRRQGSPSNDKDFATHYPAIAKALAEMPANSVIDLEIVAFSGAGKPSFNSLENYGSAAAPIFF
jgi:hypothetical protein